MGLVSGAPEDGRNWTLHLDVASRFRNQEVKKSTYTGLILTLCFEAELTDDSWRMLPPM